MSINQDQRVYLPGLNALRFFAALSVIIGHVELLKSQLGIPNNYYLFERINFGGLGVYFFFVLSGFLITYLLFVEKDRTGVIALKEFYIRRILRIWPLYYLITILSLFVLPHFEMMHIPWLQQFFEQNFYWNLVLFFIMLPNLALSFMPALPHAGQLWSIGIEEQFYLVWPLLIKKAKNKMKLILGSILVILLIKVVVVLLLKFELIPSSEFILGVKKAIAMSKFECMLIGGLGAYFLKYDSNKWLIVIYNKWVFLFSIAAIPFLSYFMSGFTNDIIHLPYALIFLVVIMNVCSNPNSLLKLENKVYNFLGKISYGLYMYHMMIIVFLAQLGSKYFNFQGKLFNVYLYSSTLLVTIIVATASYYWFEKPFLKIKQKYTVVKSGNS
jgi:peptidoglycan/LPS O-acetylase OafA/YrhL